MVSSCIGDECMNLKAISIASAFLMISCGLTRAVFFIAESYEYGHVWGGGNLATSLNFGFVLGLSGFFAALLLKRVERWL